MFLIVFTASYISGLLYVFELDFKRSEAMLETSRVIKVFVLCYESCATCSMLVRESFYDKKLSSSTKAA